jgi:hypothetical protein
LELALINMLQSRNGGKAVYMVRHPSEFIDKHISTNTGTLGKNMLV